MSSLFTVLFFLSLTLLVWGLVAPHHFAKHAKNNSFTRRDAGIGFGFFVLVFLILASVTAPPSKPTANLNIAPAKSQAQSKDTVTTKQVTDTQTIPFTTTNQDDSSLAKGQTKVIQTGKDGTKTLTYLVTYTNGQQTNQKLVSSAVTTQPINQIIDVGTYVAPAPASTSPTNCTNGTYVNSDGNTVCSPETSATVPAGATAQCVDGTYSFSQHHSGTCSHHGGVAAWL